MGLMRQVAFRSFNLEVAAPREPVYSMRDESDSLKTGRSLVVSRWARLVDARFTKVSCRLRIVIGKLRQKLGDDPSDPEHGNDSVLAPSKKSVK
jgi:hypothetical protein